MRCNAMTVPEGRTVWEYATEVGMPFAVDLKTFWFSFRQHWFTKNRKREDLSMYNAQDGEDVHRIFNHHGSAPGWRKLLLHLVDQGAAAMSEELPAKRVFLRSSIVANEWLADVLVNSAHASFLSVPTVLEQPVPGAGGDEADDAADLVDEDA